MKKILVFLLACLASTALFAQTLPLHYQINNTGVQNTYTRLNGVLMIDNVEQFNGNYEIGVFDQDGVCRGAKLPTYRQQSGQYIYLLQIRGNSGYTYTFKVYDHATETELDLVDNFGEVIAYQTNYTYQWNGSNSGPTNPYHLNFSAPAQTFTKYITGVGEENWTNQRGGYYLVASPVGNVTPSADNGFLNDDYDLYYFDESNSNNEEWRNYKVENFTIEPGKGYLYASKNGTTLTFTGTPGTDGNVTLHKTEGTTWSGWNLVGNPLGVDAYITKPFYTLENSDTYTENTAGTAIHAMQGLLVVADNYEEPLTFSTETPSGKVAKLIMNVSRGRSVIDHATISFSEGQQLPKLQFREGSTKVYIPQDGKDYAVVSSESMGEMPVNFKAEKSGTYTLSFNAEEVNFTYLHLIDNLTGKNVDLLASPSYTFDASVTDYASRFKLVFVCGNAGDDDFAFFSNGSFVISNEGNATLQVIDINGRILNSETINGCASVNIDAAKGVYLLRLINGDNVKVQKVVVK